MFTHRGSSKAVPRVIGIDLGTTNTCAGYADGRIPRVIPTEGGHNLLPSVVGFVRGRCLIGQPAKEQLLINPADTVYGSKRLIGRPYHSPQVQSLIEHFAYRIVEGEAGLAAVEVGGKVRELTEISAILLKQISRYVEAHLGGALDGAVITVPAYYPESQREAVRRAAREAGLDVWRLVNEPTAAALAYGVGRNIDQKVLVFDLGGGTFDVSILEIHGGTFHVLATGGDGFLGGVDFDIRLLNYLLDRFEEEEGVSLREDPVVVQRVLSAAEVAKCDLSLLQHVEIRLPFVGMRRGHPLDMVLHVNRQILNKLTEDLVDRCVQYVDQVLEQAGLEHGDIDEVLLAGGQTRMPMLQGRLERHFGKPPRRGLHPDEVVAQGAALLARSFGTSDGLRLLDVLSVPIGVARDTPERRAGGELPGFEVVLERNTVLPHAASVEVSTSEDDQVEIIVDLFQGHTADLLEADYLGTVRYEGLPRGPAGKHSVMLELALDVEGLLKVTAHRGDPSKATELPLVTRPPDYLKEKGRAPRRVVAQTAEPSRSPSLLSRIFSKKG